jgi:cytochrome c oxidase cbb3-type subunit 3
MKRKSILAGFMLFAIMPFAIMVFAIAVGAGCNSSPGRPGPDAVVAPPDQLMDFRLLYQQNCAGCHGLEGKGGAALPLNNAVFLAITDDASIRRATANGITGTAMPAFEQSAGGMLASKQIDAIVNGIRSWAKPEVPRDLPPLAAATAGDPQRGAHVYATYCLSCHGPNGQGGPKAGSIVNGAFLALVSDQDLRSTVIAGRPELGAPDWRNDLPGHPMSTQEISDVVSWLSAQRPAFPGQPYRQLSKDRSKGGLQ